MLPVGESTIVYWWASYNKDKSSLQGFHGDVRILRSCQNCICTLCSPLTLKIIIAVVLQNVTLPRQYLKPESNLHMLTRKQGNDAEKSLKCMQKQVPLQLIVPLSAHSHVFEMSHRWLLQLVICLMGGKKELLVWFVRWTSLLHKATEETLYSEVFPKLFWTPATRKCRECRHRARNIVKGIRKETYL